MDIATVAQLALRLRPGDRPAAPRVLGDVSESGVHAPEAPLRLLERKGYLTPWQTSKLLKGDTDGYLLGGYRLLYKIASGSFGRVFRGDDPRTGASSPSRCCAAAGARTRTRIELFEREGQVGMTMQHPNIVEILAVNQDAATGQYYIVMEFVEGGNLRDFLTIRKKLEVQEALRPPRRVARGLAYAFTRA